MKSKEIYYDAETCEKLLEELYKDNPAGVKDFRCEITTPDGKVIAEKPYKIPQAYEDKIKDEIKRLLNKGYIKESKSSWLNNVRPVIKKDGSIRLTTNLIKLNSIVELDKYSLPLLRLEKRFHEWPLSPVLT